MSHMEPHFAVRFLIIGIALIYVVGPMLRHWREAQPFGVATSKLNQ